MNVALLDELVSTSYQFQAINVAEIVGHFWAKHPSCSSGIDSPVLYVLGIWPHQVTERSLVRYLYLSVNSPHLVDSFDLWTQSSMHAEHFA